MARNYFDNAAVTEAIEKYQESLENGKGEIERLYPFTQQIQQLVKGVINTHKIYRWWNDTDELVQEGIAAVYASFKRFDSSKGTAFNYLSIVVKQHLKNWTQTKNKKNWLTGEFNDEIYNDSDQCHGDDHIIMEDLFGEIELRPELEPVMDQILYAVRDKKIFNRRDIVRYMTREGWDKKDVDEIFGVMEEHFGE